MRLIDADLLKTSMEQGKIVIDEDVLKCDTIHEMLLYLLEKVEDCMAEIIDSQPTAYDVEAVVRELEEKSNGFFVDDEEFGEIFVKTIPLQLAIEIVRGGRNG